MTPVLPLPHDPCGPHETFHPASAESSRIRGRPAMPTRRLPLCPLRLRHPPYGGDFLAARCGRQPRCRGDVRSRELRPNPIRPDTSRHGTAAIPAGNRYRAPPARPKPNRRLERSRHTNPSLLRAPSSWTPVRPACAGHPRRPTRFHRRGRRTETALCTTRWRGPHSTARHGSANELLAQPDRRGQGPLLPLLREEHRDPPHPRCLPSMSCLRLGHRTCVQPRIRRQGSYPQTVTSLWIAHGALSAPVASADLDGPAWTKTRSPL
jgi:hypothetical protein